MSQAQVPAAEARSPGPVLLSVAGGKGPGGTPRASDTVACGPGLREDRRAMTSPEIIESRFWPVIHYDITAMAAPQGLQTLRQDRSMKWGKLSRGSSLNPLLREQLLASSFDVGRTDRI